MIIIRQDIKKTDNKNTGEDNEENIEAFELNSNKIP
jgi:hypothetical protein